MNKQLKKQKLSFKEATKGMTETEIKVYRNELSLDSFDQKKAEIDSRGGLISDLHAALFAEEFDFTFDSILDAKERRRGNNPMRDSYMEEVNKKRTDLGVSMLSSNGLASDQSGMRKCEEIAEGLFDSKLRKLIREIEKVADHEKAQIVLSLNDNKQTHTPRK
jgi:hypothetical protein